MRNAVSIIIAAGALATACSGGADSGARDASPDGGDGSADPVLELLARPHVQDALAAAAAAGYPISTASKLDPPPVTGYYLKPNGLGQFVASGNGADLTTGVAGDESRVMVQPDGSVTIAYVSFDSS